MKNSNYHVPALLSVLAIAAIGYASWSWQSGRGAGDAASTSDAAQARPADAGSSAGPAAGAATTPEQRKAFAARFSSQVEERMRRAQAEEEMRGQRVAARFESTPRDPAWAQAAESQLQLAMSDPSMDEFSKQAQVRDMECRKDICRIRARFDDGGTAVDWLGPLMMGLSTSMPNSRMQQATLPDGGIEVSIYLVPENASSLLQG